MKLDTSQPKDWPKFIKDLELVGLEKLLMQHCTVSFWNFPIIVLKLEAAQQPFVSEERAASLRDKICAYYEYNKVSLTIDIEKPIEKQKYLQIGQLILILKRLETELKHLKTYSPMSNFRIPDNEKESLERCRECINNLDRNFKEFGF